MNWWWLQENTIKRTSTLRGRRRRLEMSWTGDRILSHKDCCRNKDKTKSLQPQQQLCEAGIAILIAKKTKTLKKNTKVHKGHKCKDQDAWLSIHQLEILYSEPQIQTHGGSEETWEDHQTYYEPWVSVSKSIKQKKRYFSGFWPAGGSRSKVKSWGFILRAPWISEPNFMTMHLTAVEIFQSASKWSTNWMIDQPTMSSMQPHHQHNLKQINK